MIFVLRTCKKPNAYLSKLGFFPAYFASKKILNFVHFENAAHMLINL